MDVIKTLKPGQNGTKRFVERYGQDLLTVRYRDDPEQNMRYTTVELIVERKKTLKPQTAAPDTYKQSSNFVQLHIYEWERDLQQRIKQAGGHWHPKLKAWLLDKESVMSLRLEGRIELP
jgi:hypothetical protein